MSAKMCIDDNYNVNLIILEKLFDIYIYKMKYKLDDPFNYRIEFADGGTETCSLEPYGVTLYPSYSDFKGDNLIQQYHDHHSGKHNDPSQYQNMWLNWKKNNMTTLDQRFNTDDTGTRGVINYNWGDTVHGKQIWGTLQFGTLCVRCKGIQKIHIFADEGTYRGTFMDSAPIDAAMKTYWNDGGLGLAQIAGIVIDVSPNDPKDAKGRNVYSVRDSGGNFNSMGDVNGSNANYNNNPGGIFKARNNSHKGKHHTYHVNFHDNCRNFYVQFADPKPDDWEITFYDNDLPLDVFIPTGYKTGPSSTFSSGGGQAGVDPFAGHADKYVNNISMISSDCMSTFTIYQQGGGKHDIPPKNCTSKNDIGKLNYYTSKDWGQDIDFNQIQGIDVCLNNDSYCASGMNNEGTPVCAKYQNVVDRRTQYLAYCKKDDSNTKDPWHYLYGNENGISCVGDLANDPEYVKSMEPLFKEMCEDDMENTVKLYGNTDTMKTIKKVCGCYTLGIDPGYLKANKVLQEQGFNQIGPECAQSCGAAEPTVTFKTTAGSRTCNNKECIQLTGGSGSDYSISNIKQQCNIDGGSKGNVDGNGSIPTNNTSPSSSPNTNNDANNDGNNDANNDGNGKTNKTSSSTTWIIIIIILLICSSLLAGGAWYAGYL